VRRLFGEMLLGGVRLSHALAAALWIGGTLVFALLPADSAATGGLRPTRAFREALRLGIAVFVLSGALMAVERLGSAPLPPTYFGILVVKVGLGIWMFFIARQIGALAADAGLRRGWFKRAEHRVLALGVVIYALAIALRVIYEGVIRA
jgi:putative copper export protein